ncbi:MAG: phospho-N-acetylmuramoyl-pentapeptide-transferase [Acidobacteria bacterium]|nr:phospho-N-acetylmuramoyl-pentapeptide-transferase [Acidobacteriota bacterium]
MLYWLLHENLSHLFGPFRLFGYVTFRTAVASLTAMLLCIVFGPFLIERLRRFQVSQYIREDGPQWHKKKQGTPTMGGLLIIFSIAIPTLLFTNLRNPYVWVALFGLLSYGAIGFWDDYAKVTKRQNLGLTVRAKFSMQVAAAMAIGVMLILLQARGLYSTVINVPFLKTFKPDLLIDPLLSSPYTYPLAFVFFFVFLVFVLAGSANAVNLTDGLDGLAAGLMIIAATAMTALTYVSSHREFADYLGLQRLPGSAELTIFCGAMAGASIGFLWHNAHPADVFMGDVGALALGGGMGTVAVLIKQEVMLLFIGGVYVIELLSVVIQVASVRLTGKRVFLMSPLHHHFESLGWDETKVVVRFWILGLIMALFALTTLKLR